MLAYHKIEVNDPPSLSGGFKTRIHRMTGWMGVGGGPERDGEEQIRVAAGYRTPAPKWLRSPGIFCSVLSYKGDSQVLSDQK